MFSKSQLLKSVVLISEEDHKSKKLKTIPINNRFCFKGVLKSEMAKENFIVLVFECVLLQIPLLLLLINA